VVRCARSTVREPTILLRPIDVFAHRTRATVCFVLHNSIHCSIYLYSIMIITRVCCVVFLSYGIMRVPCIHGGFPLRKLELLFQLTLLQRGSTAAAAAGYSVGVSNGCRGCGCGCRCCARRPEEGAGQKERHPVAEFPDELSQQAPPHVRYLGVF